MTHVCVHAAPGQRHPLVSLPLHARFEAREAVKDWYAGEQQALGRQPCCGHVETVHAAAADGTLCHYLSMIVHGLQLPRPLRNNRAGAAGQRARWCGCLPCSSTRAVIHVSVAVSASLAVFYERSDSVHVKLHSLSGSVSGPAAGMQDSSLQAALRFVRLQIDPQLDGVQCDLDMDLGANGAGVRIVNPPPPLQSAWPRCAMLRAARFQEDSQLTGKAMCQGCSACCWCQLCLGQKSPVRLSKV